MNNSFRDFLNDVKDRLFPDESATVLEPESPPNWQRLGWKTGWIVEEGHTGLQWWVTDEHQWDALAEPFGQTKRQRNQAFSRWYKSLLDEYRRRLGVPLKLESVRWRQMDVGAFAGRPLIEDEDWWSVAFEGSRGGQWNLLLSERFIQLFEEDTERSPKPEPPWTFLELWQRIGSAKKEQILQELGTNKGPLNHLAGLVLSGALVPEELSQLMGRHPWTELRERIDERRGRLDGLSSGERRQTLEQWRGDADRYLVDRIGEWLEEGVLPAADWESLREEWIDYRADVLKQTFDAASWRSFWQGLTVEDIRRVVPRVDRSELRTSLEQVAESVREPFEEALPNRQIAFFFDQPAEQADELERFRARQVVYEQVVESLQSMEYVLSGELTLGD